MGHLRWAQQERSQVIPLLVSPLLGSAVATFKRATNDMCPYLETHKITTMAKHHHFGHGVRPQLSYFTDG